MHPLQKYTTTGQLRMSNSEIEAYIVELQQRERQRLRRRGARAAALLLLAISCAQLHAFEPRPAGAFADVTFRPFVDLETGKWNYDFVQLPPNADVLGWAHLTGCSMGWNTVDNIYYIRISPVNVADVQCNPIDGDLVQVRDPKTGKEYMHRAVASVTTKGGRLGLVTKGDANPVRDNMIATQDALKGRVVEVICVPQPRRNR